MSKYFAKRQKMVLVSKIFNGRKLPFIQIIGLELFNSVLFVFHPEYPVAIEIKWNIYLRDFKLSMGSYLIFLYVDLVKVVFLLLQVGCFIMCYLRIDYLFCVGKAQKMTYFSWYIIVIVWEHILLEWDLTIRIC